MVSYMLIFSKNPKMKTLSTRHAELCRLFPKGTFSIITSLVVWVMSLLASDLNIYN